MRFQYTLKDYRGELLNGTLRIADSQDGSAVAISAGSLDITDGVIDFTTEDDCLLDLFITVGDVTEVFRGIGVAPDTTVPVYLQQVASFEPAYVGPWALAANVDTNELVEYDPD